MRGTTYKRCGCKHPDTGKPLNQNCPQLTARKHGSWTLDTRIDVTGRDGRRLKRGGYATQTKAAGALDHVRDLVRLAADDDQLRRRIGDFIFTKSRRGGALPTVEEVRRRLGAGEDIAATGTTVAEWLEEWYTLKSRTLKRSTLRQYRHHIDKFIVPLIGDIPRDKLRPEHVAGMFDRIEEWNAEILEARADGRVPHLPDDVRARKRTTGLVGQHRILATLRSAYSTAMRRPGMIKWNPCSMVEMPPLRRTPKTVWGPEQVVRFLEGTAEDRLALLYRIILLRGLRRGEALGLRWQDLDEGDRGARIVHTILEVNGQILHDTPKTASGERWVSFDEDTAELIGKLRRTRRRERLAAGELWQEHDLVFCQEDGTPLPPSSVSYAFRKRTTDLGLPVITLHGGRHTAATLALEAGLDIKIVSDQLGHSDTRITQDLYTHVRKVVHDQAAATIVELLQGSRTAAKGAGS